MDTAAFDLRYKKLNAAQREAVDAVEGPVMVVAGPGTGKTEILTLRIANILRVVDTNPENILALTFTEAGATNMRRRLTEVIGAPAYAVSISTFHGFCNRIIKEYPEEFPRIIGAESITEIDEIAIVESLIHKTKLTVLKPLGDPLYYIRDIVKAINDLKREGLDPAQFMALVAEEQKRFDETSDLYHEKGAHKGEMKGDYKKELKTIEKNRELSALYEAYEAELRKRKRYDYSDMIMEVLRELQTNKDLLLILQEQYQYILVDEHQDTNNAQNRILELLSNFHANPNIFVVGDEKQAIFRFQGASLENFLYFKNLYKDAKLIVLSENYRSTQAILDAAHSLIPGKKALEARAGHENMRARLYAFLRPEMEQYFIAQEIMKLINAGTRPEDIAVLYRNNRDAATLVPMLERAGVPFIIESDENVMRDRDIRKLIALLRAIDEFGSDVRAAEAMHVDFLNLDPLDIYRVIREAGSKHISIYDVLKSDAELRGMKLESPAKLRTWYGNMVRWARGGKNKELQAFVGMVVNESEFLAHVMALPDMVEKMEKLNGFFDEVQKFADAHIDADLHAFLEYLSTIELHDLLVKKSSFGGLTRRVRLMTAHKSKGQEFGHVFIVGAFDGHWGNVKKASALPLPPAVYSLTHESRLLHDPLGDERRLFYVALTRAKKSLTISYAKESVSGKEQLPSQFIGEIDPVHIITGDASKIEEEFVAQKGILFAPPAASPVSAKDKEFVHELFLERGLSATALNNYVNCPWRYFYQNLLRIPSAKEPHQLYGTAVHATLEDLFEAVREGRATRAFLLERFTFHASKQPFSSAVRTEWLERGEKALGGYWDAYHTKWKTNVVTEFDVKGILLTPDIKLSGKLDKLEILNDKTQVNVVDYKTGKPKTRGEIEGTTASSNGDIKRQLVFYRLLLNRMEKGIHYEMVSADVDFVEPDDKGRYKKEAFTISDEEVAELEVFIKKTADEILSLSFWDKGCHEKDCTFCDLREYMR